MRNQSPHPWVNTLEYPFSPREFRSEDGWMSYVDVGRGRPIVFVHGSMSWSYMFRKQIRALLPYYRCIAPDHLGFGLSEKFSDRPYRHEDHARRFAALMDYLRLDDVTLVVHDSGGPIGLSWALDHPDRVRDVVIANSFMWSQIYNMPVYRMSRYVGNPLNRVYFRLLNASPAFILPALFADRHRMSRPTQMHYLEPFRAFRDREGVYSLVDGWQRSNPWFESLWERRELIANKRALLLWGMKDPLFGIHALDRWQSVFRESETATFYGSGRYFFEESPKSVTEEIRWFLMNYRQAMAR